MCYQEAFNVETVQVKIYMLVVVVVVVNHFSNLISPKKAQRDILWEVKPGYC